VNGTAATTQRESLRARDRHEQLRADSPKESARQQDVGSTMDPREPEADASDLEPELEDAIDDLAELT